MKFLKDKFYNEEAQTLVEAGYMTSDFQTTEKLRNFLFSVVLRTAYKEVLENAEKLIEERKEKELKDTDGKN